MKQSLLLAIIALFLCFCQSETPVPVGILSKESMKEVLVDIHIAEGALKANMILGDSAKKVAPALYREIYNQHGITEDDFKKSMNWYHQHPEILEEVQRAVVEELMVQEK